LTCQYVGDAHPLNYTLTWFHADRARMATAFNACLMVALVGDEIARRTDGLAEDNVLTAQNIHLNSGQLDGRWHQVSD
jgi:hypothetical protein